MPIGPAPPPIGPAMPIEPAAPPIDGAMPIGPAMPIDGAAPEAPAPAKPRPTPAAPPSRRIRSNPMSRSMPRRSSRPANRPRNPGSRDASSRSSTCSTTCTAAVRPNRAKRARGIGSWFLIVPVASPSVTCPDEAFDSVSVSVSSPSSWASSSTPTSIVFDDSPGPNFSVPLAAR